MKKKIIIVTGISNLIGKEFMRYYSYNDSHVVIGISRTHLCDYEFENSQEVQIDLLNKEQITKQLTPIFAQISWQTIEECILIHSAGKAKNDELGIHPIIDLDGDGMDDEMFDAQITTFRNLHEFLVQWLFSQKVRETIKMTLVGFGSLMDKKKSRIHKSIRAVNNMTRKIFHALTMEHYNYHAVILSVSTVATVKEVEYRKFADQTYWLTASELVDKAMPYIGNELMFGYTDGAVYKNHPLFIIYYANETEDQIEHRYRIETGLIKPSSAK